MTATVRRCLGLAAALFCGQAPMSAALAAPPPADGNGSLQLTPYFWAAGMKGNVSPFQRGAELHVDKAFSDILKDLRFGGFLHASVRRDRWVLLGDLMYVDTASGRTSGPLPDLPPPLPPIASVGGEVHSKQFTASLLAGYRLYEAPTVALDVLGGVRGWHISNEVTVWANAMSGSYRESFGWLDPVVGARVLFRLGGQFTATVQGDVGGFGAGSRRSHQLQATLNYSFNEHFTLSAGYKTLSVDYRRDGQVFDTTLSGPVAGLTYTHRF